MVTEKGFSSLLLEGDVVFQHDGHLVAGVVGLGGKGQYSESMGCSSKKTDSRFDWTFAYDRIFDNPVKLASHYIWKL